MCMIDLLRPLCKDYRRNSPCDGGACAACTRVPVLMRGEVRGPDSVILYYSLFLRALNNSIQSNSELRIELNYAY